MSSENYHWLAALIAGHPEGKVFGRTRLQKEVKLLQRIGFPTDYYYSIYFYGPYSESLHSDIGLLEAFDFVDESQEITREGNPFYILDAKKSKNLPDVSEFDDKIRLLNDAQTVVLELAATYDAFREEGATHKEAMARLLRKKASKCVGDNLEKAISLLNSIGLEAG